MHLLDLYNTSAIYVTKIGEVAAWRLNRSPGDYTRMYTLTNIVMLASLKNR
jgi:hypothetical protein